MFTAATTGAAVISPTVLGLLGIGESPCLMFVFDILMISCIIISGAAAGGTLAAQLMCFGPVYRRARSGQCCLIVISLNNIRCPVRC